MIRYILIVALTLSAWTTTTHACEDSVGYDEGDEHILPASDNRPVPWPWILAQPFPWTDIRGTWKVEQDEFISYFAFKVVRIKETGERQLRIRQIDGYTCKELATGVGLATGQRVLGEMVSKASGKKYRIQLTSFREQDSPEQPLQGNVPVGSVMVISVGAGSGRSETMIHMQIMKVSSYIDQRSCRDDIKK